MSGSNNLKMNVTTGLCVLYLICVCLCAAGACYSHAPGEHLLFDFESDSELGNLQWKCHTLYSLSETYATHGKKSLKLELYPSDFPGFRPVLTEKDWSSYRALCFDMYNPEHEDVTIRVIISDRTDYPEGADWFTMKYALHPGMNQITIPLQTLKTIKTNRKLELWNTCSLTIFMSHPARRYIFYIDYMRLVE